LQAICEDVVIFASLLGDDGFNRRAQRIAIDSRAGADNGEKEIASGHRALHPEIANQYGRIG
jgi:hypothetical protein